MSTATTMTPRKIIWEKWKDDYECGTFVVPGEENGESYCAVSSLGLTPTSLFNMWVGHTNFTITRSVAEFISAEPGVEGFDVISRYRFRIVIGQAYSESAVMRGVEQSLTRVAVGLSKCLDFLHSAVRTNWVLVILAGGDSRYYESNQVSKLERVVAQLTNIKHVYKSWSADCE